MARLSYDNARLSVAGYGSRSVKVERVAFGMEIIAVEEQARHHRALYTMRQIDAGFSVGIVLTSHREYEDFVGWLAAYGRALTDAEASVSQVMRVIVPTRNFDLAGVPSGSPIPFGAEAGEFVWRVVVNFLGTHNPSAAAPVTSTMAPLPENAVPYFYPGGVQLAGTERGTDYAYNYDQTVEGIEELLNPSGNVGPGSAGRL